MKIVECEIPGPLIIEPRVFGDDRSFFSSWNRDAFAEVDLNLDFVQDNHSRSSRGVLRGSIIRIGGHRVNWFAWSMDAITMLLSAYADQALILAMGREWNSPGTSKRLSGCPGFAHGFLALEDFYK